MSTRAGGVRSLHQGVEEEVSRAVRAFGIEEESEEVAAHVLVVGVAADLHERPRPGDAARQPPKSVQ